MNTEEQIIELADRAKFLAWLKTQDPATPYRYELPWDCPLVRYLKARLGEDEQIVVAESGVNYYARSGGWTNDIAKDQIGPIDNEVFLARGRTYADLIAAMEAKA